MIASRTLSWEVLYCYLRAQPSHELHLNQSHEQFQRRYIQKYPHDFGLYVQCGQAPSTIKFLPSQNLQQKLPSKFSLKHIGARGIQCNVLTTHVVQSRMPYYRSTVPLKFPFWIEPRKSFSILLVQQYLQQEPRYQKSPVIAFIPQPKVCLQSQFIRRLLHMSRTHTLKLQIAV